MVYTGQGRARQARAGLRGYPVAGAKGDPVRPSRSASRRREGVLVTLARVPPTRGDATRAATMIRNGTQWQPHTLLCLALLLGMLASTVLSAGSGGSSG